jgi:hypothetical protein
MKLHPESDEYTYGDKELVLYNMGIGAKATDVSLDSAG